jgi:hypothetical protein
VAKGAEAAAYDAGVTVGRSVGEALGFAGLAVGAQIGTYAGAATAGMLGLTAGIPGSIILGKTGLSIVAGAVAAGGGLAAAGAILGTVTAAVAGYYIGKKVGYALGFIPTAAVTLGPGAVSGAARHLAGKNVPGPLVPPANPDDNRHIGKVEKFASRAVGGFSALSGILGGGVLGGLAGTGAGLLTKSVALSTVLSHGLVGGFIGAGIGAVVLGYGGYKLVHGIGNVVHAAGRKLARGKERVELEMKSNELDKRVDGLHQTQQAIADERAKADAYFKQAMANVEQGVIDEDRSADDRLAAQVQRRHDMDVTVVQRNKDMDAQAAAVEDKTKHQDELAQARANKMRDDLANTDEQAYQKRRGDLQTWATQLDARQSEYDRKNRDMPQIVNDESNARVAARTADLESAYQTRKSGLDAREKDLQSQQSQLDDRKAHLPSLIKTESDRLYAELQGSLQAGLDQVEGGLKSDLASHQADLQRAYQAKQSQYSSELSEHERNLQATYDLQAASVAGLATDVQQLQQQVAATRGQADETRGEARRDEQQANDILNNLPNEKRQIQQQADQARAEANAARQQANQLAGQVQQAQRAAADAQAAYQQTAQQYNQLEAEIQQLTDELNNKLPH